MQHETQCRIIRDIDRGVSTALLLGFMQRKYLAMAFRRAVSDGASDYALYSFAEGYYGHFGGRCVVCFGSYDADIVSQSVSWSVYLRCLVGRQFRRRVSDDVQYYPLWATV